jgi:hypothetical protein
MSAQAKEKILEKLRNYHMDVFPENLASNNIGALKAELVELQDKTITMLLRLVNGKEIFSDMTKELTDFRERVSKLLNMNSDEKNDQTLIRSKIDALIDILAFAKESNFQLRKPRIARTKV